MDERRATCGRLLAAVRKKAELSTTIVAKAMGWSQGVIVDRIESGKRKLDFLELESLAQLYGVPLQEFTTLPAPASDTMRDRLASLTRERKNRIARRNRKVAENRYGWEVTYWHYVPRGLLVEVDEIQLKRVRIEKRSKSTALIAEVPGIGLLTPARNVRICPPAFSGYAAKWGVGGRRWLQSSVNALPKHLEKDVLRTQNKDASTSSEPSV